MKSLPLLVAAFLLVGTPLFAQPKAIASPAAQAAFDRANALAKEKAQQADAAVAAFAAAIEADPEFVPIHNALRDFRFALMGEARRDPQLAPRVEAAVRAIQERYRAWEKRWPDSPGIAYGYVTTFHGGEDPEARPYLLKIVKAQPGNAPVWLWLSHDAERWGDERAAEEYMLKAAQADPANPDYAFYYASKQREHSVEKWEAASLDVARRFPNHERGAQALYWLGQRSAGDAKRIGFWEQARVAFPPAKFMWSRYSAQSLFEAYLRTTPDKAIALARDLAAELKDEEAREWSDRVAFAKAFQAARTLADIGSHAEALAVIDKLPVGRRSSNPGLTQLLKAEIMAGAGRSQEAYDSIVGRFAGSPEDELKAALDRYGAALGKTAVQIDADVWAVRTAAAKPAPGFDLGLYTSDQSLSLASLRGKVVFVTFWFPGCGPCRGEFPHFENVVAKFKGNADLVYLGINGIRQQDAYVLPFMEGTKYSFIPLKGDKDVTGNEKGYAVRGYPSNFLIDRDGRIIFSNFRADDPPGEVVLQRMIEALLARPAQS